MAAKTQLERFAVIETQLEQNSKEHEEIKESMLKIDKKLDVAIAGKTDRTQFDSFVNKVWAVVLIVFSALLGIATKVFEQ